MRRVQGRDQVTRQVGKLRQGRKIKKGLKEIMMGTVFAHGSLFEKMRFVAMGKGLQVCHIPLVTGQ